MSKTKKLILIIILTIVLFGYNNCRFSDQPISIAGMVGGNGGGYEGKPDPGTYVRQVYGALCDNSDILAQLKVSEDKVELLKKTIFNCYESTTNLLFDQLDYYHNFKEVIGYEGGIYLNFENYEKGFVPELWCRTEDFKDPRHHLFLYNPETKGLKTKWVIGQDEFQDAITSRTVYGNSATYENGSFKLNVDLSTEVIKGNKNYAASVFDKKTQKSTHLSCISGSNTLPENEVFEISDNYSSRITSYPRYSSNQRYSLRTVISITSVVKVFDLNLARLVYSFKSSLNDDYSLLKADFSEDGNFLHLFWRSNTEGPENKLEIINLENNIKKTITLGEYYPTHLSKLAADFNANFESEIYLPLIAETSLETLDKNLLVINKKTGELTNVDTLNFANGGMRHRFLTNNKYMFYIKANYKDDWWNLDYPAQILNYSLVIYNFETKVKKSMILDDTLNFTFESLPNNQTPILSLYDNESPAKILMFDEVSESFKELNVDPLTPIVGGVKEIVKIPNSNDFYFIARSSDTAVGLLKFNFDEKKLTLEHLISTINQITNLENATFNFYSNTLLYRENYLGLQSSLVRTNIMDLNKGNLIASFDFENFDKFKPLKEGFGGIHHYVVEELVDGRLRKKGKYSVTTFKEVSEKWVRNLEFDGLDVEPIFSQNSGNIIYIQKDLSANEYVVRSMNIFTNKVVDLLRLDSLNNDVRWLNIAPNEKFIFIYTTQYEVTASGRIIGAEEKVLSIRTPSN